jgi:hypothetical protein
MVKHYELCWYKKNGPAVGMVWLEGLTDDQIRSWFGEEGTVYGGYRVTEQQRVHLERLSNCLIDLGRYNYYVEDTVEWPQSLL